MRSSIASAKILVYCQEGDVSVEDVAKLKMAFLQRGYTEFVHYMMVREYAGVLPAIDPSIQQLLVAVTRGGYEDVIEKLLRRSIKRSPGLQVAVYATSALPGFPHIHKISNDWETLLSHTYGFISRV